MNAIWQARDRFKPAPTARRMCLGGRRLLFCERRQQLFELNAAADMIWGALLEESPLRAARRLAAQFGGDLDQARGHIERQLAQWLRRAAKAVGRERPAAGCRGRAGGDPVRRPGRAGQAA
jgi:hypothetical protein